MSGRPHALRSQTLPRYLARLRATGFDLPPLLRAHALPPDAAELHEVEVPLEVFQRITDEIADALHDPFMGLNLAKAIPPAAWGVIELSARSAPSFGAAAQRLVRYVGLLNDFEVFSVESGPKEAAFDHRVPGVPRALGRHGNEQLLVFITRVIRELLQDPNWSPSRVSFAHAAPSDPKPIEAFFGSRIDFGQGHNTLHFPLATLELPVATANATLLQVLDDQAHRELGQAVAPGDELGRIRDRLRNELQDGAPSLDRVAEALKMSARTLQRRLGQRGLTFTTLVDETRRDLAQDYVGRSNLALNEVAFVLGYSDLATFIRAFKRWTGSTPRTYREQHARR